MELEFNATVSADEELSGSTEIAIFGDTGELSIGGEHSAGSTYFTAEFSTGGGGGGQDHEVKVYRE